MELLKFLKSNSDPLLKLGELYAIKNKRHIDYDNLVLLKYDQLNSPMGEKIVQECRGIILDERDNWNVVCRTYDKFFNYGESNAAQINWEHNPVVYEKLDGSLMQLYFYDGEWRVASSGMPCASGFVSSMNVSFRDLFWKVWNNLGYSLPKKTGYCYAFEMMTPYNRVVVRHETSKIVLHGVRRLSDFKEFDPSLEAKENGWKCVDTHSLSSWKDILNVSKNLDPMDSEGFVVCDSEFNRVKVKTPAYVAVSHMKEGFTTRRMLEIVRTNENSEFLSYYPEYTELFNDVRGRYESLLNIITKLYNSIKHIDNQKDFAMQAKDQKFSGVLFGMRNGKELKSYLADMNIKTLEDWLELNLVEL